MLLSTNTFGSGVKRVRHCVVLLNPIEYMKSYSQGSMTSTYTTSDDVKCEVKK